MVTYWLDKIYKAIAVGLSARSTGDCVGWKLICKAHGAPFVICPGYWTLTICKRVILIP